MKTSRIRLRETLLQTRMLSQLGRPTVFCQDADSKGRKLLSDNITAHTVYHDPIANLL